MWVWLLAHTVGHHAFSVSSPSRRPQSLDWRQPYSTGDTLGLEPGDGCCALVGLCSSPIAPHPQWVLRWAVLLLGYMAELVEIKLMWGHTEIYPCAGLQYRLIPCAFVLTGQKLCAQCLCLPMSSLSHLSCLFDHWTPLTVIINTSRPESQPHKPPVHILLSRVKLKMILLSHVSWKISKPSTSSCGHHKIYRSR